MNAKKLSMSNLDDDDLVSSSMHVDMTTSPIESKLTERMKDSRAEVVMTSVRMKKSERNRLKNLCSQYEISAQDLIFEAVNLWCQAKGVRGLE